MQHPNIDLIDPREYDFTINLLREFFREKHGFIEVPVQHRLSILAACEDPRTIGTFNYTGELWPLPQTGQMWLEYELLTKPDSPGYYCISTSYRNEPNPVAGRHNLIFPMFEFETKGGLANLLELERSLLKFIGFDPENLGFATVRYELIARMYNVKELTAEHENRLYKEDYTGPAFFLTHFPVHTSPFWNMKKVGNIANKVDVILHGIETIGSAERSTDLQEMRESFHTISDGMYADILYAQFGKERVEQELESFLAHEFFPRCGGGIGITRMIRALKLSGILK
ncbi:MAG: transposase [Candidatus Yanofskybacteria bacterium RIFCSPHIGHO2_01_FULL_44_17]|uniref:Transposase n=1 Tax=Candidatus Yanofskybacteria bacterium RIFCSPHIGHO2_01_FULL_44_17 TaxID=1802668 RepID=A0A1F8EW83_9BACT|nr:MAG: transposase [Candidatus Yanofskybacteria bacterium RIFCSPHIGHO2_01_FULL_44_17]